MYHSFLNLDKPLGMTAHDCVAKVRKLLQQKRVGHSGTLDPLASGVLPIALGQATRLIRFLPEGKDYRASVRFGVMTATDDLEGPAIASSPCPTITLDDVMPHLPTFIGTIQQRPPSFSAVHVEGKRLYELARAGKAVEAPLRQVEVRDIRVLDWRAGDYPEIDLAIACGTGTYIRSIARDLGNLLGCGATLAALQRTSSNGFALANSLTFEAIALIAPERALQLVPPESALQHLPAIVLDAPTAKRWCNGMAIELPDAVWTLGAHLRVCGADDRFLGIGEISDRGLQPVVVLAP